MAQRVIHRLEQVEVEHEHVEALAAGVERAERFLHFLAEMGAVGQIGEVIVARHVGDLRGSALPLGDVLVHRDPAAAGHRLVLHRGRASVGELRDRIGGLAGRDLPAQIGEVPLGVL